MKNIDKYLSLLNDEVDGLLLTSPYSRYYGAEFEISEGVAVVSKKGCRYFTDSRYIESAENGIKGFEVLDVAKGGGYVKCINQCIEDFGITAFGFEENYLTVSEYMLYEKNVNAKLVPFTKEINGFRGWVEEIGVRTTTMISMDRIAHADHTDLPFFTAFRALLLRALLF